MRTRRVLALVIAASLLGGSPALAEPATPPGYEDAFSKGTALFDRGEWAEARAAFEEAYALAPRPVLLFNIASTYRREGKLVEARDYYQRFLAARSGNDALEEIARTVIATIDAGAANPPTDARAKPTAGPADAETAAAEVAVPAASPRRPTSWMLAAGYGSATIGAGLVGWGLRNQARADELEASAEANPDVDVDPPSSGLLLGSGLALVGLGVAGTIGAIVLDEPATSAHPPLIARWQPWAVVAGASGILGGVYAVKFAGTRDELNAVIEDSEEHDFADAQELEDRAHTEGLIANIALGVAAASAAASVTALIFELSGDDGGPVVRPIASGDQVGAALVGRF
jgi:hypothetical protein